jgi:hypothetical protein
MGKAKREDPPRIQAEARIQEAAERVARLSRPGTPERLFTLIAIAEEMGIPVGQIVTVLVGRKTPR